MSKQEKNGKSADDLLPEAAAQAEEVARAEAAAQAQAVHVKVRVLVDCHFGKVNDVVVLDTESADLAQQHGIVDAAPEAVAYAESLTAEK